MDDIKHEAFLNALNNSMATETPPLTEKPVFHSSIRELVTALGSYLAAWIYTFILFHGNGTYGLHFFTLFTLLFTVGGLVHYRERLSTKEHWIWLGCLWIILISMLTGHNRVWGGFAFWFMHCYAIYWILCLSGHLINGRSSSFILSDALHGLIVYPMKHLFCCSRIRVLFWGLRSLRANSRKRHAGIGYAFVALGTAGVLFLIALKLLTHADANFASLLSRFRPSLDWSQYERHIVRFVLSLPIGAYLFGLVAGTGREDPEVLETQKHNIRSTLAGLQKVPVTAWVMIVGVFGAFYLLFLGMQGSYLFGGFLRKLPDGFTVAEYARQGFFELLGIMALNFLLLWLVAYSSRSSVRERPSARGMCTVLLAESILFAATAMSKLCLYISCFGFTPLRLQSFWAVLVLTAGCVCWILSLWTGKRTMGSWVIFTGVTLALLHLY